MARGLDIYAEPDIVGSIQTDTLGCFHLLPIINDENLPQAIREQATAVCLRTNYESLVQPSSFDGLDLDAFQEQSNRLIANIFANSENTLAELDLLLPEHAELIDAIIPPHNRIHFATDMAAVYQAGHSPLARNMAYYYFAAALSIYYENQNDLDVLCPMMLASEQFCQIDNDSSCRFAQYLLPRIEQIAIDPNISLGSAAQCALTSSPTLQDRFISFLKTYYYSDRNFDFQPFTNFWLVNDNGSASKSVITNALFAGLLASRL